MKNWKSLFVKNEEEEKETTNTSASSNTPSFPVNNPISGSYQPIANQLSPETAEVLEVYEKGLDSINMPGYDFYEFYKAVQMAQPYNEQSFNMAYQMAKTMDGTVTVQKLVQDAEFYISKINDVHSQYVAQGQAKLTQINDKKLSDKSNLTKVIDNNTMRIAQLKSELANLEQEMQMKRNELARMDEGFAPQEQAIRSKLNANDIAKGNSITKLTTVRDYIQKFIKNS